PRVIRTYIWISSDRPRWASCRRPSVLFGQPHDFLRSAEAGYGAGSDHKPNPDDGPGSGAEAGARGFRKISWCVRDIAPKPSTSPPLRPALPGCARNRGRGRGSRVGRGAPPGHTPGRIYVLTFFAAFLTFLPLCLTSALPWSALPSASSLFLPVTFPAASLTFPLAFSPVFLAFLSVAIAAPLFGWSESAQRRLQECPTS